MSQFLTHPIAVLAAWCLVVLLAGALACLLVRPRRNREVERDLARAARAARFSQRLNPDRILRRM